MSVILVSSYLDNFKMTESFHLEISFTDQRLSLHLVLQLLSNCSTIILTLRPLTKSSRVLPSPDNNTIYKKHRVLPLEMRIPLQCGFRVQNMLHVMMDGDNAFTFSTQSVIFINLPHLPSLGSD